MEELNETPDSTDFDRVKAEKKKKRKAEIRQLKKKLAKYEGRPGRGIETWFRLTSKNLYTRLKIVDTKANILITANAIIISVVLGSLYPRLQEDAHLIFPVGVLVLTNVVSIAFSILATIPRHIGNSKSHLNNERDIMSFDDFHQLSLSEYRDEVLQVMEDANLLYPSMITDIHSLGNTLARKYKLIRKAYLVFLTGMIISILFFGAGHSLLHMFSSHH